METGPYGYYEHWIYKPISSSGTWAHFSDSIYYELRPNTKVDPNGYNFTFWLAFNGHPTLYFDGFSLTEDPH